MKHTNKNEICNPYAQFADKVRSFNGMCKIEAVVIGIAVVIGCITVSVLNLILMDFADAVYMIAALFAVMYGTLFPLMHCAMYVKIDGKGNSASQYLFIHNARLMVVFSIEEYYKEIARRLKKKTLIIAGIVFGLLLVTNIWNLSEHFIEVIGLCFMTIGIMVISNIEYFYIYRFLYIRRYYSQRKTKRKADRGVKQTGKSFYAEHPLGLGIMVFVAMIISIAISQYRDYSLRILDDIDVRRTVTSGFWLMYPIMICIIYAGEQIGRLITRKDGSVKNVIGCGLVIVIAMIYGFTFYTTYYEDKIVTNRLWQTKEYAWSDVQSYTVKKTWIPEIIQLELEMEDRTLSVIPGSTIFSNTIFSEKCEEEYIGDYGYIAHLVEKMDDYGIPGKMEDEEVIAPDAEINDPEEMESFDRIKMTIYGN